MAVLPIHEFPDAVLRRKAEPVVTIDDTLQRLIDDMIQTMYDAPGIGLAAPQVGVSLRLFVVDVTSSVLRGICHRSRLPGSMKLGASGILASRKTVIAIALAEAIK